MSANSKIEWTDTTWNPVTGCSKVSAGCKHCYAERMSKRLVAMGKEKYAGVVGDDGRFNGVVRCHDDAVGLPLRWRRPRRVFVNSMGDLFHEAVPFGFIDRVFAVMRRTPQHTYQILTKRPVRMALYYRDCSPCDLPLPNVWLGTSVENQDEADLRIPWLLKCPAAVRFLSCEPLLAGVDLDRWFGLRPGHDWQDCVCEEIDPSDKPCIVCEGRKYLGERCGLHWVIAGGESGPGARPMHPDWVRGIRDQCVAAGVPFFFKQWGRFREFDSPEFPAHLGDNAVEVGSASARAIRGAAINPVWVAPDGRYWTAYTKLPEGVPCRLMEGVGKLRAGRVLDGRTWDEMPGVEG